MATLALQSQASAHERYRERLAALADDELVAAAASRGLARTDLDPDRLARRYECFQPALEPYATLVVQAQDADGAIVCVEAFRSRPPEADGRGRAVLLESAGWLLVRPFQFDPLLPTLPALLSQPGHKEAVRYRPGRHCTLRVDDGKGVRYARIGRESRSVHECSLSAWQAAERQELGFRVARPLAFDARFAVAWQEQLSGGPAAPLLYGAAGASLAERIGIAAGSLTRATLRPARVLGAPACLEDSAQVCRELRRTLPGLRSPLNELLGKLREVHARAPARQPRPIHGDLNPPNMLYDGDTLGVVDFERLAFGDVELDAATFVAEVEAESDSATPVPQLVRGFLAGYEQMAGPLDHGLLGAYRAQLGLRKVVKRARDLRPDGDCRAERRLIETLDDLERESV